MRHLLAALTSGQRAELLDALTRPPTQRAQIIGEFYARPGVRNVAELFIDLERTTSSELKSWRN